ncbi:hypothetical protein HER10_EVM0001759 [Colletotrichum scovillei]|uniref:Rhamnogalacturonate lyase n=1 Tax=Colletotrichum scovillei TaxID=1209932 RepID=A0A9P7UC10_9PEZI|nr:uncharacterized protein HER10_EVM0001759 [Colletotrichum scovillei]KAF4780743.1 hypothetical protein HER10_EVM0001759 [Colletotrichum scovillei]KAG7045654.1 rhamnogalacturonate lyase [Colletotrichum scovillei]KAG7052812.1 rhamnogalacturonate lyase [Colletotrichum scovillei]KAG7065107.1 rhamnogalacturonate lyase [Colletotrichum scovillei]
MADYVGTFMKTHAGERDPSWQVSARGRFSEKRRQEQASLRVHERTRSFKTLISTFAQKTNRKDLARFDVEKDFQWEDVRIMASEAVEQDNAKTKMRHNPFRAAGRSFQRNASNLEMLVAFLPNGDFTGILCGALTFVFCAAKRLDEVRNKILNCLDSLPDIVEETEEYVEIYDDDPRVWKAAEDLYLGILDGVESMLQWIDKSAMERAFKVLTRPTTFGKNVEEDTIKQNIEGNVAKFRNVVLMSQHKHINKSLKALKEQLNSQLKYADWVRDNPKAERLVAKAFITLDELRASIGFDPKINQRDMVTSMIDAQKVCPPEMISHAMLALRDNKFASWLQSNESQILFIEGRMKLNSEQEASSPLTMLSCALAQLVARQSERSLPLVYLCGQHNRQDDPYSGVSGVLRCWNSLIAESLTPRDVDLSAINLSFIDGVRAQRLDVLCMLFRHLVLAATDKVVFVILDGASWLEVNRHVQGLGDVVLFLSNLVTALNQQNYGVIVKVLITNPSTSSHARKWLPKDCILEMDDVR